MRDAALLIRELLEAARLKSWPLLSGGKGAHVVAPLDWRDFFRAQSANAYTLRNASNHPPWAVLANVKQGIRPGAPNFLRQRPMPEAR